MENLTNYQHIILNDHTLGALFINFYPLQLLTRFLSAINIMPVESYLIYLNINFSTQSISNYIENSDIKVSL